ncbi:dihydrofolate reductase, partial [Escherichia coli]|uniref:dihydrofolate reductase n=1 Tax=Escherichia coli TaxID=562 RepID=UPI0021F3241D
MGYKGGLPWPHNSEDMKWFKESTRGDVVVMGRKTWESIGKKPLPKRKNIIISSERQTSDDPWVDFDTSVQNTLNELG